MRQEWGLITIRSLRLYERVNHFICSYSSGESILTDRLEFQIGNRKTDRASFHTSFASEYKYKISSLGVLKCKMVKCMHSYPEYVELESSFFGA